MNTAKAEAGISSYHTEIQVRVVVESFGYLHGPSPTAHIVVDLRSILYNPHADPAMRDLTGLEPRVRDHVLATPGAIQIIRSLYPVTRALLRIQDPAGLVVRVAFGCAGGRHRAVAMANEFTHGLINAGIGADVLHRDILRPVQAMRPESNRAD